MTKKPKKEKEKKESEHPDLEKYYLQYAARLATFLGTHMSATIQDMPLEYKFKVGSIALASLTADFCYAIINKEHPELSKKLMDDIYEQAHVILQSRFANSSTKQ
jgi:hypothetical protein